MFKNVPNWIKVILSLWVVLVIVSAFLPPVGTATSSVGTALGRVAPAVANSVPNTGTWLHDQVCDKTEKC